MGIENDSKKPRYLLLKAYSKYLTLPGETCYNCYTFTKVSNNFVIVIDATNDHFQKSKARRDPKFGECYEYF